MKIMRYAFYRHCYLYQSLKVSRQWFSRCSNDEHSNFVRSLNVTWWPDLEWPGSAIFTTYPERCMNTCAKTAALRAAVFWQSRKNPEGAFSIAPQSRRRFKWYMSLKEVISVWIDFKPFVWNNHYLRHKTFYLKTTYLNRVLCLFPARTYTW